jgi:cold shock CspA family protein
MARLIGKVEIFNPSRGFGFIRCPGYQDFFVHFSEIEGGKKIPVIGQLVEFTPVSARFGRRSGEAHDVTFVTNDTNEDSNGKSKKD